MGILEFHFHDSTFEFAPGKNAGGERETESAAPAAPGVDLDESRERTGVPATAKKGVGVLVALGVLVGLGALGKKLVSRRRGAGVEEPAASESEGEDAAASNAGESIEVTDD